MKVEFSGIAWEQHGAWESGNDRKTLKKIRDLIQSACRTPYEGLGKPEPLKGDWEGYWSRRIDQEHRFVYKYVDENGGEDKRLVIARCKEHY